MGSSESTRSRPDLPIRLGVLVVGDDHPRACTGRRLVRLGLAEELRGRSPPRERPIVLDPYAERPLTTQDVPTAETGGIVAVDCSWSRLADGQGPARFPAGLARRLPMLVATNPQHFGRLGELNTAEALAAALFVLGRAEQGRSLLSGFAGGETFFDVNRERLLRYAEGASPEAIVAAERALFESA